MNARMAVVALCLALLAGCSNKEKEEALQQQLAQSEKDRESMKQLITERDSYVEDIVRSVNEVYADLEQARISEGRLLNRAGTSEKTAAHATLDTRQKLLQDISEIGTVLKENRKRISDLESRAKASSRKIAGLDALIENMKKTLAEREQSIAELETKVQGLEATVTEKIQTIAEKEAVIDDQQKKMNTAYYVVGTRDELEEKGIISDEGGFLWGLLGSTSVLASGISEAEFTPIDETKDQTIHVPGKVEEILPRRQNDFFAMAQPDENNTELTIVNPPKFWQDRYLVIVVD